MNCIFLPTLYWGKNAHGIVCESFVISAGIFSVLMGAKLWFKPSLNLSVHNVARSRAGHAVL